MDLFSPVTDLRGVGPARAAALQRLGIFTLYDLLAYFPRDYEDRTNPVEIAQLQPGVPACFEALVVSQPVLRRIGKGRDVTNLTVADETGKLTLHYFNQPYIKTQLHYGQSYYFYGTLLEHGMQMANPAFEEAGRPGTVTNRLLPVYPLTAGLSNRTLCACIRQAFSAAGALPELLPETVREQYGLCGVTEAYTSVHAPESWDALQRARKRLVFEEFFIFSAGLAVLRASRTELHTIPYDTACMDAFFRALPFRLTGAQSIRPVGEACLMLFGLDGHEQGVILQPEVLPGAERVVGVRGGGQQPVGGLFQHQRALAVEDTIINGTHRLGGGQLGLGQETLLDQQPVINKIGVACESGKALVRAVSVAGRANGQDLPIGLLRSGQKIHKRERFFAQCANAKGAWQAEHGHQDAACTHFGTLLVVLRLTLDSACHDALDDVLLAGHVQDDDGDDGNDDAGHHGGQLHAAITAAEVLDGHGDGAVFLDVQHQRGQEVVVPDPHGLQNGGGDHGRLEDGENDLEEDLEGAAAVDHGGLLDLNGDALHEAGEHEDGQARAEAQIDDADVPRGVQLEGVRRFGQGEHDHLEWHDHGEDDEQVHELAELVVDTGEVPARHGAAQQDEHHAGHRDEQAVAQAGEEVHLEDAVDVVGQARKRLFGGQLEDGGGGERALHLETVN